MPAQKQATHPITIYLIKRGAEDPGKIFDDIEKLKFVPLGTSGSLGTLYYRTSKAHPPSWIKFFEGKINARELGLSNSSASAVLLTKSGKRTFVLTFGYGWMLLNPSCVDENFGLKVALNTIDASKIRSIDRITFDAIAQHSQIQASRESSIGDFGLDVDQDLLRAELGNAVHLIHSSGHEIRILSPLQAHWRVDSSKHPRSIRTCLLPTERRATDYVLQSSLEPICPR